MKAGSITKYSDRIAQRVGLVAALRSRLSCPNGSSLVVELRSPKPLVGVRFPPPVIV